MRIYYICECCEEIIREENNFHVLSVNANGDKVAIVDKKHISDQRVYILSMCSYCHKSVFLDSGEESISKFYWN